MTRLLRIVAVGGAALAIGGAASIIADGHGADLWSALTGVFVVFAAFFAVIVWLVAPRQPKNPVVWTMTMSTLWSGLLIAGLAVASRIVDEPTVILRGAETAIPANLPRSAALTLMLTEPGVILATFPLLTFGMLLFPDGHLPSAHWRWAAWFAGVSLAAVTVVYSSRFRPTNTEPAGESPVLDAAFYALLGSVVVALVGLVVKYRRTSAVAREQFKWVVWGASIFGAALILAVSVGGTDHEDLGTVPFLVGTAIFLVSYGVAVGKYRLFDIDVIISKSVVYLGLLFAITAVYALIVAGPLLVVGVSDNDDGPGLLLPIVATGVVAMLFEPIRARMERAANRLVYGNRATPHEVLSQVTSRLADAEGASADDLAELVAEGTGADQAVVLLVLDHGSEVVGSWSADGGSPGATLEDGDHSTVVAVRHEGERLGALGIVKPPNDPVTPADKELLDDVAAGAGLILRNMRLNTDLENRAAEVRESRRRLIEAQDRERHRLERDLHDGAQQQVVALKVKLGIARTVAQREGADEIADRLVGLADDTQEAVDALRGVAHGIYPPLLESEGLVSALRAVERTSSLPIELEVNDVERYERSTEATVYFCVTETLERARMSGATSARVGLAGRNGDLVTEIDLGAMVADIDLRAVSDRLDAAGGSLTVHTRPERGRCVVSSLPIAHRETVTT